MTDAKQGEDYTCCEIIIAVFIPPLAVYLNRGCTNDFWINLILTFLFYIPGLIHALYLILKNPEGRTKPLIQ